jgi:hypothetical protein
MRYLLLIIAVEALTQLICKSELLEPLKLRVQAWGTFFEELLSCPYCISVWCAGIILIVQEYVPIVVIILVLHRTSNFLHDLWGVILQAKISLILNRK